MPVRKGQRLWSVGDGPGRLAQINALFVPKVPIDSMDTGCLAWHRLLSEGTIVGGGRRASSATARDEITMNTCQHMTLPAHEDCPDMMTLTTAFSGRRS